VRHRYDERQEGDADDDALYQVGERHAPRRRVRRRLVDIGRERAADIGADHQRQRERRLDDAAGGKRHHQQHGRQAGMDGPGEQRADQHGDDVLVLQAGQRCHEGRRAAQGLGGGGQQLERQQHQAEPDRDPAEMARLVLLARQEGDDAGRDHQR
jgi:hypothetical protein